jgi:hypothetical protein
VLLNKGSKPHGSSLTVLTLWDNKLIGGLPDTQGSMQVGVFELTCDHKGFEWGRGYLFDSLISSSLTVLTLWDNKLTGGGLPDTQGSMQVSQGIWVSNTCAMHLVASLQGWNNSSCCLPL